MSGGEPMRLAWAGPLKPGSAIGRIGVGVAEALARRGWRVDLIATDHEWAADAPHLATSLPVTHARDLHLPDLATTYDSVVVNVGDHFLNHAGVFPLLDSAPCLAVMHDMYLVNLFNGWLWWNGSRPGWRAAEMARTYGAEGLDLARRIEAAGLPLAEEAQRAPMTEWIARRAAGCLAHARWYAPRLEASCAGPVEVAALPVASRGVAPLCDRGDGGLTLLTVGHVNPNKGADLVIEALAASPALRDRVTYRLVGPVEPAEEKRLKALAARLSYRRLSIEGAADEAGLQSALEASDIIACLRRPVLEGASASVAEAMLAGRPTLVADAGCYADLPDDAVVKLAADLPVPALTAALERLAADGEGRRALGARARAHAGRAFALEAYLDVLEPLMHATARAAPVLRTVRGIGERLASLGLSHNDPAVARIAATLTPMLNPAQPLAGASQGAKSAAG